MTSTDHGRPLRASAGAAVIGLLAVAGCAAQPVGTSEDAWLAASAVVVDRAAQTLRADADARSVVVPATGRPDPYVIALATAALGREGLGRAGEEPQREILDNLIASIDDLTFPRSSADRLYTAAALLEADRAVAAFDDEQRAMLESVVLDAARTAPDYYDHVDARVVVDALPVGGESRQEAEDVIQVWSPRAAALVCSGEAAPLEYWIAATVRELDIPCTREPPHSQWLHDARQIHNAMDALPGVGGAVCEEARWLLRSGDLWWPADTEVADLRESIATSLQARASMSGLIDPLQCTASLSGIIGSSWAGPTDPTLLSFLTSVAGRGETSATITLDSYSFIRFIEMSRMLNSPSVPRNAVLELTWDEAMALGGPLGDPTSWPAPTVGDPNGATVGSHVLESVLRSNDDALCAAEPVEGWVMYALARGQHTERPDLTLDAQAILLAERCGWHDAVPAGFRDRVLADATRLHDDAVMHHSLAGLWTAESVLCALDPGALSMPDDLWPAVQHHTDDDGAVYLDDVISVVDTYYAVSLLSDHVSSCGDHGVMDARR